MSDARKYPEKYVVIFEIDTGYMECVAVCDNASEAYGEAVLSLCDGLEPDEYYITPPMKREGENGYIMQLIDKESKKVMHWVTVLFYRNEGGEHE